MPKDYELTIKKIKRIDGPIGDGYPKMKVKFTLVMNGWLTTTTCLLPYDDKKSLNEIEKVILLLYVL